MLANINKVVYVLDGAVSEEIDEIFSQIRLEDGIILQICIVCFIIIILKFLASIDQFREERVFLCWSKRRLVYVLPVRILL